MPPYAYRPQDLAKGDFMIELELTRSPDNRRLYILERASPVLR